MKKFPKVTLYFILILLTMGLGIIAYAQDAEATEEPQLEATEEPQVEATEEPQGGEYSEILTFAQLGMSSDTFVAINEQNAFTFRFALPAEWEITDTIDLQLDINALLYGIGVDADRQLGGTGILGVSFNGYALESIIFNWDQDQTIDISIPAEFAIPNRSDQRHELRLLVESGIECGREVTAGLFIRNGSTFSFSYDVRGPLLDLRYLPFPFYQQTFVEDVAIVVVPDDASSAALEALLNLTAGFGDMTFNALTLQVITESQLTNEIRNNFHMIYVGEYDQFNDLESLELPMDSETIANQVGAGRGILQITPSPFAPTKAIMLVTGTDEQGIRLAGNAISTPNVRASLPHDVAIIETINPVPVEEIDIDLVNASLGQVGIGNIILRGTRVSSQELLFEISDANLIDAGSYIDVAISHSTLINYEESGFGVLINGTPVGTIKLSDETSNFYTQRLSIPGNVFRTGTNVLRFEAEMNINSACNLRDTSSTWINILANTRLFIPQADVPQPAQPIIIDLNAYPLPFINDPDLSDTVFVLPREDVGAWNAAVTLIANLGRSTDGRIVEATARFPEELDDNDKAKHLIAFGTPDKLEILSEWSDLMPVQFKPDSNFIEEEKLRIGYELPNDRDIGYIQLFPSPYVAEHVVMVLTGSTDLGVNWAATGLAAGELRRNMFGDFAVVDDIQVIAQRVNPLPERILPENTISAEVTPEPSTGLNVLLDNDEVLADRPDWILPAMRAVLIGMVGLVGFVLLTSLITYLYRRIRKNNTDEE